MTACAQLSAPGALRRESGTDPFTPNHIRRVHHGSGRCYRSSSEAYHVRRRSARYAVVRSRCCSGCCIRPTRPSVSELRRETSQVGAPASRARPRSVMHATSTLATSSGPVPCSTPSKSWRHRHARSVPGRTLGLGLILIGIRVVPVDCDSLPVGSRGGSVFEGSHPVGSWRPCGQRPQRADLGAPGPGLTHPQVRRLGPGMRPGPGTRPGDHAAPPGRREAAPPPPAAARMRPETVRPHPDTHAHRQSHARTQDSLDGSDTQREEWREACRSPRRRRRRSRFQVVSARPVPSSRGGGGA